MKKLLGSTLALALLFPYSQANAELLKNFKLSGQLDVQAQADRNVRDFVTKQSKALTQADLNGANGVINGNSTFNDRLNDAQTRVLLHLDWDLLDDVHAKVTLRKNDRTYGTGGGSNAGQAGATGNNSQYVGVTGAGQNPVSSNLLGNLGIDQATFKINKVFGHVDSTFGRQFYGNSGDLVIYYGPSDKALYGLPSTALDAVRADWMGENMWVTGVAGKQAGSVLAAASGLPTNINNIGTGFSDVDVRGVTAGYKIMDGLKVDAHLYNRVTHANGSLGNDNAFGKNDNLYVYGATGKYEAHGFSVSVEFEKNNGENRMPEASNGVAGAVNAGRIVGGVCPTLNGTLTVASPTNPNWCYTAGTPVISNNAAAAYEGYAWKIDANYKADIEGIASFTPWTTLAWGTGRGNTSENKNEGFHSINGDFRPGDIYGRFAASGAMTLGSGIPCLPGAEGCSAAAGALTGTYANGIAQANGNNLNNRVIWGAGLKATPAALNQLTAAASWWGFWQQRVVGTLNQVTTNGLGLVNGLGSSTGSGQLAKNLGNEIDFDLTWKHSENVTFSGGVAGFYAGTFIKNLVADQVSNVNSAAGRASSVANNPAIVAFGDVRVKF